MPKSWYTITVLSAFLATAAILQWWQSSSYPLQIWIALGIAAALCLFFALLGHVIRIRRSVSLLAFCIPLSVSLAFLRVAQTTHVTNVDSVESLAINRREGDKWKDIPRVTLRGVISEEPDRRPLKTKYTVAVDDGVHGRILVTDYAPWPPHSYGDEVIVTGILERPTQIEDFHYDRYLSRYGIYAVMYRATVKTVSSGHGHQILAYLYDLKERCEQKLNRLYPEPHASFMAGLLTGSRRGIPEHLLAAFQATGLTHIIAISGYNIAIVIAVISGVLFFLPRKWRLLPALIAIAAFTFFVGASPSVVRAAIMGGLGIFALHAGRQKHALIAILITAAIMTAWNPKILWYDAGFQLSFISVIGLTFLSPFLDSWFRSVPEAFSLRESLQMTIAAQIAAVPLIALLFGRFSIVAPIANVIAAPLIPFAMLSGFLGVLVGFLSESVGRLVAYPGWGALELIIRSAKFLATLPYASLQAGSVNAWWVAGYYVVLVGSLWWLHARRSNTGVLE